MKRIFIILILTLSVVSAEEKENAPRITEFAFGGTGFGGETSEGEKLFRKLYSSENPIKEFQALYKKGNNEEQMYALVAFFYLDHKRFKEIKEALIFGSRALGTYKKASDIDIAIKGDITFDTVSKLTTILDGYPGFPYKVDIINYEVVENQELKKHIDQYGEVVFKREGDGKI